MRHLLSTVSIFNLKDLNHTNMVKVRKSNAKS